MSAGTDALKAAWRNFQLDGVPASGANEPSKTEIRAGFDRLATDIAAAAVGDLGQAVALLQPMVDAAQASAAEASAGIANWRSPNAAPLSGPQAIVARAIKQVVAVGFTGAARGAVYRFTRVHRNDGASADLIRIYDENLLIWQMPAVPVPGKESGPVWVTLTNTADTSVFHVLIDYREFAADGTQINLAYAAASPFEISDLIFREEAVREFARTVGFGWRTTAAPVLLPHQIPIAGAIKAVRATGFTGALRGDVYRFTSVYRNDATFADRLQIAGSSGAFWRSPSGLVAGKNDGPVWVTLTSTTVPGTSFSVLIDYRELPADGVAFAGSYTSLIVLPFELNDSIFTDDRPVAPTAASPVNVWRATDADALANDDERSILAAVQTVEAVGVSHTKAYRLITVCRGHPSFGDRLIIWDEDGAAWSNGSPTIPGRADGPVWTTLTRTGDVGYFNVLIDYRKLVDTNGDGLIFSSGSGAKFKLSADIFANQKLREAIAQSGGGSGSSARTPGRALRIALAGSSITWGSGWLGQESYVGTVDDYLRYQLAETVHGAGLATSGWSYSVSNPLFFRGSCTRLENIGASAAFSLTGDEVSLCIARPRGVAGAAICELLIDGVVHDTFTTLGNPVTNHTENFTGNGSAVQFDLGRAFTFGHTVTVNGVPIVVAMNTGGFGSVIPVGADAMIIRRWSGGEVHHFLLFRNPPANLAAIAANFNAGESVTYMQGSIGQVSEALTSANESPYGDGVTAFDPANPAALSAGLDFRSTDERSILTWKFNATATRSVMVRVKELAPSGTGTPELWLNFATNRMHRLMNAGIGGKAAGELLADPSPVNITDVIAFQPDIVCIEFGTNDDWQRHVYRAWQTRTGLTAAQVRNVETANYYAAVRKIATDNYDVDDQRLPITAITPRSVTFTATGTTFNIVPGDAIVFGDFFGDNRRLAARVVKTWDAGTRTATWGRPLSARAMAGIDALSDITTARVFGSPGWVAEMGDLIDVVRDALPSAQIAIGTCGIPNIRHRRLEGYRELAAEICADKNVSFIDFYGQTLAWQYSQPATVQMYIDASNGTTSTGATSYVLHNLGGSKPDPLVTANWNFRGWSVKVDGVERINRDCHVYGGAKRGWAPATDPVTAPSTGVQASDDYTLVFTSNEPVPGSQIDVKRAPTKWAADDCHPVAAGMPLMAAGVNAALDHLSDKAAAQLGMAA